MAKCRNNPCHRVAYPDPFGEEKMGKKGKKSRSSGSGSNLNLTPETTGLSPYEADYRVHTPSSRASLMRSKVSEKDEIVAVAPKEEKP